MMLITLSLLVLWILSMYFYLPLPVVVLLFAALATGTTITIWHAWISRKQRLSAVGEQDTNLYDMRTANNTARTRSPFCFAIARQGRS